MKKYSLFTLTIVLFVALFSLKAEANPPGYFSVTFNNGSNGSLRDDEIYIEIINTPTGKVSYVTVENRNSAPSDSTGTIGSVLTAAPDQHLVPFTLANLKNHTLYLPENGQYYGTRIYFSIQKPLYMTVNPTGDGYIQPSLEDSSDPNYPTPFDWFEMAYDPTPQPGHPDLATVAFGGNTSKVDQFSIPIAFTVTGMAGTRSTHGITLGPTSSSNVNTRDELITKYLTLPTIAAPFKELAQLTTEGKVARLIAPYHSPIFKKGGRYSEYFDGYIKSIWNYYAANELDVYDQPNQKGNHYTGRVTSDGLFTFYRNGVGPFTLAQPTTNDLFICDGSFQPGGIEANAFGAMLAAACNRGVAITPNSWLLPQNYYQIEPANDWSKFWHEVTLDSFAYGFGFDDVSNQSSVTILSAHENLLNLTFTIGW